MLDKRLGMICLLRLWEYYSRVLAQCIVYHRSSC